MPNIGGLTQSIHCDVDFVLNLVRAGSIIEHPMCLEDMMRKNDCEEYTAVAEVVADFETIAKNARTYNSAGSSVNWWEKSSAEVDPSNEKGLNPYLCMLLCGVELRLSDSNGLWGSVLYISCTRLGLLLPLKRVFHIMWFPIKLSF